MSFLQRFLERVLRNSIRVRHVCGPVSTISMRDQLDAHLRVGRSMVTLSLTDACTLRISLDVIPRA